MARLVLLSTLGALALVACGRPSEDADVKLVGVGNDPDEIGPSPTAYGGIVEYDHVDLAGAGLPLGLLGLLGYEAVGPEMVQFAPPYEAVFGFSYIFDTKLVAADTLVQLSGAPPEIEDSCYTAIGPGGPIGSFNTVDVGDTMELFTEDGSEGLSFGRFPTDYPPDAQDVFVYYIGLQSYTPKPLAHRIPGADDPGDPLAMEDVVYRKANFPFGKEVKFSFLGGFTRFDQPVSSIPRPSVKENGLTLPDPVGGVRLSWVGPRYDHTGAVLKEGENGRCFEFYEGRDDIADRADCDTPATLPTGLDTYDAFRGQMYTAPWETEDGVHFEWTPSENDEKIVLSVRFLDAVDTDDAALAHAAVEMDNGDVRPATACEDDGAVTYPFDEASWTGEDGALLAGLQGDPSSNMVSVTCLLANDGQFELTADHFRQAFEHIDVDYRKAGGAVFFFGRSTETEANIPPAKDPYDLRHDINPIKILSQSVRVGRFWCGEDGCAPAGE